MDSALNNLSLVLDDARSVFETVKKKRHEENMLHTAKLDEEKKLHAAQLDDERKLHASTQRELRVHMNLLQRERKRYAGDEEKLEQAQREAAEDKRKLAQAECDFEKIRDEIFSRIAWVVQVQCDFNKIEGELRNKIARGVKKRDDLQAELVLSQKTLEVTDRERIELQEENIRLNDLVRQSRKSKATLKYRLKTMNDELMSMRSDKDRAIRELSVEKEKTSCQICLECQRDTICLPCGHLYYCYPCLEGHRRQNETCPSCGTVLTGVLRTQICM